MKIAKNSVVSIHYTLKDGQGQVLDSSSDKEPLTYLHGSGNIIPGLEEALESKSQGDRLSVVIPPEKAYGLRDDRRVQSVLKSEFKEGHELKVGMQFQVNTEHGPLLFTIIEVTDTEVVVDGNHPLAGTALHFDVEVSSVREATQEELQHGHVHGAGGHHH